MSDGDDGVIDINGLAVRAASVTRNVDPEVIITSREKVQVALYRELPRHVSGGQVVGNLGLLVALITTLVTSDFRDAMLPPATWTGVFLAASVAAAIFTMRDIVRWVKRPTLESLVESICKDASLPPK